ncbi:MAG: PIG-L family deacetylase [Candidatus Jordarchaeaceae archaeon]
MNNVIVVAPHPDDETLGCGGTIAKKIHEGCEVFVIYMTDGRYALTEIGEKEALDPLDMKELRKKDALKAAEILGLKERNLFFLEIEDKNLKAYKDYARKIVLRILKDVNPSELYLPQRKEYNLDHRMTHIIVKEALRNGRFNLAEYQYAIAWVFPFYLLYHLLNERIFDLIVCNALKCNLIQVNISRYLPIKERAVQAYQSQLLRLSNKQQKAPLKQSFISRFLKNYEKFFVKM